jgi:two-component system, cell cycle response regulator DivK
LPTILVIEDDPDNQFLVRILLEQGGYAVVGAGDGREGLETALRILPDLILLDLTIPAIDGWQLAAELKAKPSTRHIPVVALSAHTLPGDRSRAQEAGCDGFIAKPLDVPNFVQTVTGFLKK